MLDSLRGFATTWVGKIVGIFLLIGLAGFGATGAITSIGANNVATVGGEDITIRDFQRIYNAQLNNLAARTGAVPTPAEAVAYGLPGAALNQLGNQAALTSLSKRFDLGVSDGRLSDIIAEDPNFGGLLGGFEQSNFQRVLEQNGYTQNEYFADQRDAARRQQLSIGLFAGMKAPKTAVDLVKRYSSDTRTIDYFVLSETGIESPAEPTDAEISQYLADNQAQFRTAPTRKIDVMVLSPEALVQRMEVTEEEIAADYERTKASYVKVETRTISQVLLSSDFLLQLFEDGKAKNKSFAQLLDETGVPATELGSFSRGQINDTVLRDAAFALNEGDFVIIRAAQGMRAVSVTKIDPGGQQSLDEVRDQIADKVKLKKARDSFIDVLDQIEELRAAFRPLDEIAGRYGLIVTEADVTATGAALDGIEAIPADARTRVATAMFNVDQGDLAPTVTLGANLNVWFDIKDITEARDQTIEEVGEDIRARIIAERTNEILSKTADEIVAEVNNGRALIDAASARSLFPQLSQAFGRQGDGTPVIDARVAVAAFAGGPGHAGQARNGDGDFVIFQVVDVTNDGTEPLPETIEFVDQAVINGVYAAFNVAVRDDMGFNINENVLAQVLAFDGQ